MGEARLPNHSPNDIRLSPRSNSTPLTTAPTAMNSHEHLYEKLNTVHASLRKEKDDAYRTKQLAEQRLQLARQDREAAEKKGNETRAQLRQLKERVDEMKRSNIAADAENKQMEKEVRVVFILEACSMMCVNRAVLTRVSVSDTYSLVADGIVPFPHAFVLFHIQFNFQHSELQIKKEKLSRLEDKRAIEANGRHCSVTAARDMLRRLREDSSKNDAGSAYANLSTDEKRRKLEHAMEVDGGERLLRNFPDLVKMRREQKAKEVKELEVRNASLRRVIAGYQNALGTESIGQ